MPKATDFIEQAKTLETKKQNFKDQAQEVTKYCIPHKARVTIKKAPGTKVDRDVYDSTAIFAAQVASAGLQGFMTSPASRWFQLGMQDREVMRNKDVQMWLQGLQELVYDTLNGSNFNNEMAEFYHDLVVVPGATLYEEEDEIDTVRFFHRPFEEMLISDNVRGVVDLAYRQYTMTVRQAMQNFGENKLGAESKKLIAAKKFHEQIEFLHCVGPRDERVDGKLDAKNMPFYSVYVSCKDKKIIREGGYMEFPYFIGRWRKHGSDTWAYTPAMTSLPDIRMLNKMDYTTLKAAMKLVDPPLELPDENYLLPLNMNPSGVNYRTGNPVDRGITPIQTRGNIPIGIEMLDRKANAINRYFFVDMFLMLLDSKNRTAFEVSKLVEQKMLVLGPVIGRLMTHTLNPIIQRTVNIILRAGLYPEPPEELVGKDYVIEYISPLARAQKMIRAQNIQGYLASVAEMSSLAPQVLDKIDFDKAAELLREIHSVDPELMNSDKIVKEIRQQRQEVQQQERALALAMQGGQAGEAVGKGIKELAGRNGTS